MPARCRYFLSLGQGIELTLGDWPLSVGKDMDDVFPGFLESSVIGMLELLSNYLGNSKMTYGSLTCEDQRHCIVTQLICLINAGAHLMAEDLQSHATLRLAYADPENPDTWLGREVTLKYLGITQFKADS